MITQIIAEKMKSEGFDGLVFHSSLDDGGLNIVLFDLDDAEVISGQLYETRKVSFEFAESGNPYSVRKEK